jgi:hypothetical protein
MKFTAIAIASLMLGLTAQTAIASDYCSELWYERNQIYKDNGYCFKTRNAIRAFGNAGCSYDDVRDVPLSARESRRIQQIVREERNNGCKG